MKLKLSFIIALLAIVGQARANKEQSIDITVNGQKRNMICYTPNVMKDNMPLFIVTHGMNQNPEYQRDNDRLHELVDTAKFVLCYLRSDGNTWDIGGTKDLNFVKQTITEMNTQFGIDKKRVYWAGFSMGSMLIYHGIENGMADYITAFAPCSGVKFSEPWKAVKKPINLIHCHSKYDEVFPIDQYQPRDYAAHFADVNQCTEYKKTTSVSLPGGWDNGDKERWWNGKNGSEVEIFMCNGGGHWPTFNYAREIWGFCKRFTMATYKETYQNTYKEAADMVEMWAGDVDIFTGLKLNYNKLKNALETNSPDAIDLTNESATTSATTKLQTAINTFVNSVNTNIKTSKKVTKTEFDPNFHIYLCFGQSNMEGNATPQMQDYAGASTRFLMMAPVKMSTYARIKGGWYVARPPLCRDWTGLTPADYFGKTLIKNLPDSITVGVINVALGGCAIEMFNEDGIADYIKKQADWLQSYAREYDNNPFRYLVDMAKKAQQVGVIKGILLHQGESNNCQQDWPQKVNLVYTRLLKELGLDQKEVPLLVGEMLQQDQGGICWGHNNVIATVPNVIENAHVVSSKDCPGASDGLHFTAAGYRMIGENYANVMLKVLARYLKNNDYSIRSMRVTDSNVVMAASSTSPLYVMLTDADGIEHDVTASCQFTSSNPDLVSFSSVNVNSGNVEGDATVTATYTNNEGQEISVQFKVSVRLFPLIAPPFDASLINKGTFTPSTTSTGGQYKSTKGGMGGWHFLQGLDLSDYHYLAVNLKNVSLAKPAIRVYDTDDLGSTRYHTVSMQGKSQGIVDLTNMTLPEGVAGSPIDPSHICYVGITTESTSAVNITNVYVSNSDPTAIELVKEELPKDNKMNSSGIFDLSGRKVLSVKKGIYIKEGKKVIQ